MIIIYETFLRKYNFTSHIKIIYNSIKTTNQCHFFMNDFWNNISRYPRFFISSLAGLILIILAPFKNLFKIKKFRIVLIIFFLLVIILLYNIIANMTGL